MSLAGLQHARLPCPSLSPRVCSNSCLLCWWCHPTISSSVSPFDSCPQSFFQWVSSSHQVAKVLELQIQPQSFQWIFRILLPDKDYYKLMVSERIMEKRKRYCHLCHLLMASVASAETMSFYPKPNHQVPSLTMGTCNKAKGSAHWKPGKLTKFELKFIIRLSMKNSLLRKLRE